MPKLEYKPISSNGWIDYALLDSGNNRKLERFGPIVLDRFEPDACWEPSLQVSEWQRADRKYIPGKPNDSGYWESRHASPDEWTVDLDRLKIALRISASRHVGIFPEQLDNWRWLYENIRQSKKALRVLNLFAYTGVATLYCALAGARTTHVDASRGAIEMAKMSQSLSGLNEKPIRWIADDAVKFVKREIRRGNHYDAIILDPPQFGRGPKGEVWKFEQAIKNLLGLLAQLLSETPVFLLLTAYNIDIREDDLANLVGNTLPKHAGRIEYGPLIQMEKTAGRSLKQSVYVRQSFME